MKKTLSILLIVTMLLSMFAMAIPTFATTGSATVDNTKTPGHADYDHVTKAEFAAALNIDETAVNVITNYAEFCAISGGADANNIKYYLVDLSADDNETLELTGKGHVNKADIANIYIDFNGYSLDVSGDNNAAFGSLSNATVKNLKLVGERRYVSDKGSYSARQNGLGMSPLTANGYGGGNASALANAANGVLHLYNILSTVENTIHQQHGGGDKHSAGIVASAAGGSTFEKCVFDGSILISNDEATMATSSEVLAARIDHTAGIVGYVSGGAIFKDCVNNGNITLDDNIKAPFNGTWGESAVGGVAGRINGEVWLEGCENKGHITLNRVQDADADQFRSFKHCGGVIGYSGDVAYLGYDIDSKGTTALVAGDPCVNRGNIYVSDIYKNDHQQPVGGVIGSAYYGVNAIGCENYGDIEIAATSPTVTCENPAGGIVGNFGAKADTTNTVQDCYNEGDIIYTGSANSTWTFGGIVAKVSTDTMAGVTLNIIGCTNKGDIKDTGYMGGILGWCEPNVATTINIENCKNEGAIEANKVGFVQGSLVAASNDVTNNTTLVAAGIAAGGTGKATFNISGCTNTGDGVISTVEVTPAGYLAGIVARVMTTKLTIKNCVNDAPITAEKNKYHMGGLVGYAAGAVDADYLINTENGVITSYIKESDKIGSGGIFGKIGTWSNAAQNAANRYNTTMDYCMNFGDIVLLENGNVKNACLGGMVGIAVSNNFTVNNCINAGDIGETATTGSETNGSGGMMGFFQTGPAILHFENCVNTGTLYGRGVGGMLGSVDHEQSNTTTVKFVKCVNAGTLHSYWHAGGMLGFGLNSTVVDADYCLNIADMTAGDCAGGIVGWYRRGSSGDIDNCAVYGTFTSNTPADVWRVAPATGDGRTTDISDCNENATFAEALAFASENNLLAFHKATIENEIEVAKALVPTAHKYTAYTWDAMIDAIEEAEEVVDTDVMTFSKSGDVVTATVLKQKAINDACAALVAARTGLVKINDLPKALDGAIKAADEFIAGNKQLYTADTWAAYVNAVNAAKAYQAATDLSTANPADVEAVINDITTAKNALVKGGDIFTAADFAKLDGQEGTFNLMADITITEAVPTFKGILNGNGHTITVDGCALFGEIIGGADVENARGVMLINVEGTADEALFGKATGYVAVAGIYVDVEGEFDTAVLFDDAAEGAEIYISIVAVFADKAAKAAIADVACKVYLEKVIAEVEAPALTTAEDAEIALSYLVGVEAFDNEGNKAADLSTGVVAYALNVTVQNLAFPPYGEGVAEKFAEITFVQVLGTDAYPVIAPFAVNGSNVVAPIDPDDLSKGFKNAAYKYEDATPVIPVEPIAPLAPNATGLQSSITAAEALTEADYTAETWAALKTALDAAKAALTADNQADIDAAKLALDLAVKGLKKPAAAPAPSVNLDAINAAIAAAEAKNAGEYTAATWSAVQTALSAAKSAKALGDQAAVDAATAALNAAVTALVKQAAPEAPVISKPAVSDPAEEKGCGSVIGGAAVVLTAVVALGAGVSFKKKED